MNLYLISQEENDDWDTYDMCVVCAETEEEAKAMHPDGRWSFCTWASKPENVKCEKIGTADDGVEKGFICKSFCAG